MRRHLSALLGVLAALLVAAAPAAAQQSGGNAPPGVSGLDEYLETIPGPEGERPTGSVGRDEGGGSNGGRGSRGGGLSSRERERLAARGGDGEALVVLVDATAPGGASGEGGDGDSGGDAGDQTDLGPAGDPRAEAGPPSPLAATIDALTGDSDGDGLGWLLPAILVSVALAGVIAFLLRRRLSSAK